AVNLVILKIWNHNHDDLFYKSSLMIFKKFHNLLFIFCCCIPSQCKLLRDCWRVRMQFTFVIDKIQNSRYNWLRQTERMCDTGDFFSYYIYFLYFLQKKNLTGVQYLI
ncbi:hypothetical protein L9F63_002387, partial [Diploptera punctata]